MNAPSGWLPDTTGAAQQDPFGCWTDVSFARAEGGVLSASGELLAATTETVTILPQRGRPVVVASHDVREMRIATHENYAGWMWLWWLAGSLSTVSGKDLVGHGAYMVWTLPGWLVSTLIASIGETWVPVERRPQVPVAQFSRYARFPQGVPPGCDVERLQPKAVPP